MVILTVIFPFRDSSRKSNKFDRFFSSVPILENEFFFPHRFDQILRLRLKVIKTFYSSPSTHTIGLQIISLRSSILLT